MARQKISARAETSRLRERLRKDGMRLPHGYEVVVRKRKTKRK